VLKDILLNIIVDYREKDIPDIFSWSKDDTGNILIMIGKQDDLCAESLSLRGGYQPKKLKSRQLYILQGFPRVGPVIAKRN